MGALRRSARVLFAGLAVALALSGCGQGGGAGGDGGAESKGTVRVGSKIDVEGPVLGQIMIALLEDAGYDAVDKTRTGTTEVVRKALLGGEIDAYPEYTATALTQFFKDEKTDPAVLKDADGTYERVKALDEAKNDVVWLERAPANNTWAVAVPRKLSESEDIRSLEDWAAYIERGGAVKLVGSQEFFDRADAFPAFEKAYGFSLRQDQKVALATGDTAVTEKAAAEGSDGANAAMAYGTDGTLAALELVVLEDPKNVQPVYQPAPTFRKEFFSEHTDIADVLDPAFAKLDLATLQELNGRVAVEGRDAKAVAREWLAEEGLLEE